MIQPHTPSTRTRPARLTWLGAAALALALAACGSPATPSASGTTDAPAATTPATTTPAAASFPVDVVTGAGDSTETVTIAERPDAIVSLSPTATESLFAIGAGDQVVAVDSQSDYPAEAPITDLSGYTPNVEAILAHEPDLVVASTRDADLIGSLANAGVPTLALPSAQTLDEAYGQIERLGTATGHLADAKAVVAQMDERIQAAVDATPKAEGATYFHELDPTLYTVTSDTFIGEVYGMFGLTSIADAAGTTDLYPQLSEEYVVAADPDLIFLSDTQCCGVTPASLGERAGWAGLSAVTGDRVHVLDEDVASRWGPRVVDFVETVSDHVTALQTAHA
ncbi:ABC transporter substrate-binding protein [Propioniciclava soli]|uniref:ABC transporter substrate-binding protein n=1 Tax=Propioniciclava soli TaxID=2775081 RepID=UPI001E484D9C